MQVHCVLLKDSLEGLEEPPVPGPLGDRIYREVSEKAWQLWLEHQTMLINENRLNLLDEKAHHFLIQEMEKFFFGSGSEKPAGFVELDEP